MTKISSEQKPDAALRTVLSFLNALNNEDFNAAAQYLNEDLKFFGVLGSRDGATAYLNDIRQLKIKYRINKSFTDDHDVCILCDFQIDGINVFGSGWYQLINGKISLIRVFFRSAPSIGKIGQIIW